MQKLPKYLQILGTLILATAFASAASFDASQADIAGVKLYMTKDEAITALKKHYKDNYLPVIENEWVNEWVNEWGEKKDCAELEYINKVNRHGTQTITILMMPLDYTKSQKQCVVSDVIYQIEDTKNGAIRLKEAAINKYGKPKYYNQGDLFWCKNPFNRYTYFISCGEQPGIGISVDLNDEKIELFAPILWKQEYQYQLQQKLKNNPNALVEMMPKF